MFAYLNRVAEVTLHCLIVLLVSLLMVACDNPCENRIIQKKENPEKGVEAVVFERGCGATTPFMTIVALSNKMEAIDFEDSVSWVFVAEGQPNVTIDWADSSTLAIQLKEVAKITKKSSNLRNFVFEYR